MPLLESVLLNMKWSQPFRSFLSELLLVLLMGVTSRARPWFRRRGEAEWMGVGSGCSHRGAPFRFGCDG